MNDRTKPALNGARTHRDNRDGRLDEPTEDRPYLPIAGSPDALLPCTQLNVITDSTHRRLAS